MEVGRMRTLAATLGKVMPQPKNSVSSFAFLSASLYVFSKSRVFYVDSGDVA